MLLDHSRPAVCYLPLLCSGDRAAKRRSPAGEYLDQPRHGWRPGKPGGRAVKPARQADVSARLREGVVPIDQDRGRAVEAPRFRLFLRGDQDALDFDPAPKFFESLLQSVVSHVPVGTPIEVEKLELHASILRPPLPPEVLPDGTQAHAADRAVALEVNGELAGVGVDGADRRLGWRPAARPRLPRPTHRVRFPGGRIFWRTKDFKNHRSGVSISLP